MEAKNIYVHIRTQDDKKKKETELWDLKIKKKQAK